MLMTKMSSRHFCHFMSCCSTQGPQTRSSCTKDAPSLTASCRVATGLQVIASDNNTEYKCQDALGQPTEQNQCGSHLFCSSESCSVSSFLPSSPPASSLRFTPNITFRILQSERELMENSSTISSEDNLWIEETLIWGHRTGALAVPLMQRINCFRQCCLGCAVS